MTVRILREGPAGGASNMTRDETLARQLERGEIEPTVRIYGWAPPAISIGFHQREDDFDVPELKRAGIDLVRRPTGGKAILHAHEVTYCAVLPLSYGAPRLLYLMIHEALLGGIRSMGIPAELNAEDQDLRRAYATTGGIPCFSTSVGSEIQVAGKKLVGSAQRRFGRVVLQHGSFLLGAQHRELARFVRPADGSPDNDIAASLTTRTTDAESILGRPVSFNEAANALAEGFEQFFAHDPGRLDGDITAQAPCARRTLAGLTA